METAFALAAPRNAVKFYYSKRKQPGSGRSATSRQLLQLPPPLCGNDDWELGAFYEIDHTKLPPKSPIHLKAVRIVKVSETSKLNVTVSFPSTFSLRNYFSSFGKNGGKLIPELDEMFVMSTNHAGEILRRLVPGSELDKEKHLQRFWLVGPFVFASESPKVEEEEEEEEEESESDDEDEEEEIQRMLAMQSKDCHVALKHLGVTEWGVRRKVKYVGRHRELPQANQSATKTTHGLADQEEMNTDQKNVVVSAGKKRSREASSSSKSKNSGKMKTSEKSQKKKKNNNKKKKNGNEKKKPRNSMISSATDQNKKDESNKQLVKREDAENSTTPAAVRGLRERWSAERYKAAELKLLDIMKEKEAKLGSPILRGELREEARKHIGDTGLLDHLLKHMAGKVVSNETERFRRRHNGEGAMEYWLEPAELEDIRQKAGVVDPYWLPPPGWKLGDATTQCLCGPECKKQMSQMKEEIVMHKKDIEELQSLNKQLEIKAENRDHQSKVESRVWQDNYQRLLEKNTKLERDMVEMVVSLKVLKDEMMLAKKEKEKEMMKKEEEQKKQRSADPIIGMIEDGNMGSITIASGNKMMMSGNKKSSGVGSSHATSEAEGATTLTKKGGRRSGFRICKPQGTFLWPNMQGFVGGTTTRGGPSTTTSTFAGTPPPPPQYVSHVSASIMVPSNTTNIFFGGGSDGGIPTPPSCSSSATSAPNLLLLPSPTGVNTPTPSSSASPLFPFPPTSASRSTPVPRNQLINNMLFPSANYNSSSPPSNYMGAAAAAFARASSSTFGGCEVKYKREDSNAPASGGGGGLGWSSNNITTDLVLATPSPNYQHQHQL